MAEHWLSFSNSDQKVLHERTHGTLWDGLVVPGTLATYYKQGVGGYVLARRKPFVIDPRTPLIQPVDSHVRPEPRASHKTLAAIHSPEVEAIWESGEEVYDEAWTPEIWDAAVKRVLDFQTSFESDAARKLDKYEQILRQGGFDLDVDVEGPKYLIPPYWAVGGTYGAWWDMCIRSIELAAELEGVERLMPVLCVRDEFPVSTFLQLIDALPDGIQQIFCWRGMWNEAEATDADIDQWIDVVSHAAERGIKVWNMYGGALSALLTGRGLAGVNHGVGYSEFRATQRLGSTGAPPMRFYVPLLRRFMGVPEAQRAIDLLAGAGFESACGCHVCRDRLTAVGMGHNDLKTHFLLCRSAEIRAASMDFVGAVGHLRSDAERLVALGEVPDFDKGHAYFSLVKRGEVLKRWASALEHWT